MLASFPSCSGRGNGRWPKEMLYGNGSWRDSNFIPVDAVGLKGGRWPKEMLYGNGSWRDSNFIPVDAVGLKGECGGCWWAYDDAVRFAS